MSSEGFLSSFHSLLQRKTKCSHLLNFPASISVMAPSTSWMTSICTSIPASSSAWSVPAAPGETHTEEETTEDMINRLMESKRLLRNASDFAFTATPKNKTLEIFGEPVPEGGITRPPAVPQGKRDIPGYTLGKRTAGWPALKLQYSASPPGAENRNPVSLQEACRVPASSALQLAPRRPIRGHMTGDGNGLVIEPLVAYFT